MDADSHADIDAAIDVVYAVVSNLELVPRWQPDVTRAECLERDEHGRAILIDTELVTAIRTTKARLRISYQEPTTVSWVMQDGDVRAFEGSWTLIDLGHGRTRAHYAVRIDFGRTLGLLLRGPAGDVLRGDAISSMPHKLKAFVEDCVTTTTPTRARARSAA